MIVLDTMILAYAVGGEHPLAPPSRRLLEAVERGSIEATTTIDVIQEFAHVRARRRPRADAADLARDFASLLSPLVVVDTDDLEHGLRLFEQVERLDVHDAVLAAAAVRRDAEALVSADRAFASVPDLRHVDPAGPELEELLSR